MKSLATILMFIFMFLCTTAQGADKKKFPCPGVPKNADKAVEKSEAFFKNGVDYVNSGKAYGALERFLCSLKMASDPNTMTEIEKVAFAVAPKKDSVKLLIKFRNRNRGNPSVPDIQALLEQLQASEDPPAELQKTSVPDREAAPEPEPAPVAIDSEPVLKDKEIPIKAVEQANGPTPRARKLKAGGITSIVLGSAILGLGGFSHFMSFKYKNKAMDATDYASFQYYEKKMNNLLAATFSSYLFGSIGIIIGAALVSKSGKPEKKELNEFGDDNVSINVSGSPTGILVSGTF